MNKFLAPFIVVTTVTLSVFVFYKTIQVTSCPKNIKIIKNIGACNKDANCGVEFTDGTFGQNVTQPVKGQTIDYCYKESL